VPRLNLAFPRIEARDTWGQWFTEYVRLQEQLSLVQHKTDRGPIGPSGRGALPLEDRSALQSSVRDFTRLFLTTAKVIEVSRSEAPNKGKVDVSIPSSRGSTTFAPCTVSGRMHSGDLTFQARHGGLLSRLINGPESSLVQLSLTDETIIRVASPFGSEFTITTPNGTWAFRCKDAEVRQALVHWMRLVKGRGELSQSEAQTFPFMMKSGRIKEDALQHIDCSIATAIQRRDHIMRRDGCAQLRQLKTDVAADEEHGTVVGKVTTDDGNSCGSDDDEGMRDNELTSLQFDIVELETGREKAPFAMRQAIRAKKRAEEDALYEAYDRNSPTVSNASQSSVRTFHPHKSYQESIVRAYLDRGTVLFLAGRSDLSTRIPAPVASPNTIVTAPASDRSSLHLNAKVFSPPTPPHQDMIVRTGKSITPRRRASPAPSHRSSANHHNSCAARHRHGDVLVLKLSPETSTTHLPRIAKGSFSDHTQHRGTDNRKY